MYQVDRRDSVVELHDMPRPDIGAPFGGIFNLDAGNDGPEYASGVFRARFHWFRPTALLISTTQQGDFFEFKGNRVAPQAKMFLRTEAGFLDRFVAALPALDRSDGEEAVLECLSANPAA